VDISVAVVGGGSWGTTVAHLVSHNALTKLWCRDSEVAASINQYHKNLRYLPDFNLADNLRASVDLEEVLHDADIALVAIPSQSFREVLCQMKPYLQDGTPILSLAKGLEQGSTFTMTQVVNEELPENPTGVLSGPNLAQEVLQGFATASVLAMANESDSEQIHKVFLTENFRVYTSTDVRGCELGGAFKNVLALAAGMTTGLGTGDNTIAAVITRGLAELTRLGEAMGARRETFSGLAGLGDLIATSFSAKSRNRFVGEQLGKGKLLDEVISHMDNVAEGVMTAPVVSQLAKEYKVETPITDQVSAVVNGSISASDAYELLMLRDQGSET
jgi:glycerol-3-phosphate dehydrogenase (NAD(P)+)|tara:strand:- start:4403 stop:5395 length:993 start_codon:yes stop_codon:yes gene_type:complete